MSYTCGFLAGLLFFTLDCYSQTTYPYSTTGQAVFVQSPYNSSLYTNYPYNPSPTSASRLPAYTTNQAVFVQQPYGQAQQTITSYPARSQYGLPYSESNYASPTAYPSTVNPAYPYATTNSYTSSPYTTTSQVPTPGYPYTSQSYTSTAVYPYTTTKQLPQYPNATFVQKGDVRYPTSTYNAYPETTVTQYPYTTTTSIYPQTTTLPNTPPPPAPRYVTNRQSIMREAYDTVPGQVNVPYPTEIPATSTSPTLGYQQSGFGLEGLMQRHGELIYQLITATFTNSPSDGIKTQLTDNANAIGRNLTSLYGTDVGGKMTALLQQNIQFAIEYFNAIKTNNETMANQSLNQWIAQGQAIGNFVSTFNANIPSQNSVAMWTTQINLEAQIAIAYAGLQKVKAVQYKRQLQAHLGAMGAALSGR